MKKKIIVRIWFVLIIIQLISGILYAVYDIKSLLTLSNIIMVVVLSSTLTSLFLNSEKEKQQ
jgi:hypothetical protein